MTYFVFAVPSRASIGQAAALMAYEGVHRCVVTGDGGQITGIVTALDIARWVAEQNGYVVRRWWTATAACAVSCRRAI
jgi:CBS domain-containing protein